MGAASTRIAKERGKKVQKKYYKVITTGVVLALLSYILIGPISVNRQVKLAQYEHCLQMQNQALSMLFDEYKKLPQEDTTNNFDHLLSLVKTDPKTGKVEWMTTSLDICKQYLP